MVGSTYRNPAASHYVSYCRSLLRHGLEHAFDDVLGVRRHAAPLGLGECVLARLYALFHARRNGLTVGAVEGRVATAQNVHDHAQ